MIIRLSILGRNDSYMKRLLDFCRADYADKLELSCFSEIAPFEQSLSRENYDIVLIDETLEYSVPELPEGTAVAWLTDEVYQEKDGLPAICRYQGMSQFYRELLALYAEHSGHSIRTEALVGEGALVFAVIGSSGGCGASCVAAALAKNLAARKRRVVYINLEPFGDPSLYFQGEGKETFSDLVYALKSNRANLGIRMESIMRQDPCGVYFYAAPENPLERQEMTPEEGKQLILNLQNNAENDAIVVDIPFDFQQITENLLRMASRIIVVAGANTTSHSKLFWMLQSLKAAKETELLSRMVLLNNHGGQSPSTIQLPVIGNLPEYSGGTELQVIQAMANHSLFNEI